MAVQSQVVESNLSLRALLSLRGSYPLIASAVVAGRLPHLDVRLFGHVGDVYGRVEIAAGDDVAAITELRLAALLHEEPPESLPRILRSADMYDCAPTVVAVIGAFGGIWRATTDADVEHFVTTHRLHLASIVLFELAHEGRAIAQIDRAAELGGLQAAVASWTERLAGVTRPTPAP